MKVGMVGVAVLGLLGGLAEPAPPGSERDTVYFFFSPESRGSDRLARRAVEFLKERQDKPAFRPVLLVDDFKSLSKLKTESVFVRTLQELAKASGGKLDIAPYDEEGLALAKGWKIARLPALVLASRGQAHVATGSGASVRDIWEGK